MRKPGSPRPKTRKPASRADRPPARTDETTRASQHAKTGDGAQTGSSSEKSKPRRTIKRPKSARGTGKSRSSSPPPGKPEDTVRVAKALAQAGLCSRRDAERWIADGRVNVNGTTITSPALDVTPNDTILVDGKPLPQREPTRLWRYHKPRGQMTTHRDPQGRDTVFDNLPSDLPRVISVGRLDYNTEGLLLLTTDGELARYLELPATGWLRRYRVRAHGRIQQSELDALMEGVVVDGVRYGPIEATLESRNGANCWIAIGLREGKNREVRNVLQSLGLTVNRLIRVSYGPFQLLDLRPGDVEPIKRRVLIDQLGDRLAAHLKLDDETATRAAARAARPKRSSRPAAAPHPQTDPSRAGTAKRPAGHRSTKKP